ncbi:MAG: DNA polymerase III subunit delta [Microscillaceae bacterium]|nr:DNA polymerase III subunit delta [Microscillaceae bacterium]MDW8459878.1 DNA polymerase III subunit delta [Cytophagales bacterium]
MLQSPETILAELKKGNFAPIYFLHGEESFYIDEITNYIEKYALKDEQKSFNQTIAYGRDLTMGNLLNYARRFPIMSERQVLIVKELQEMSEWGKADTQKLIENYIKNPQPSTILVLAYKHKTFNKNTNLYKLLEKHCIVVETKRIAESKLPEWITQYVAQRGVSIEPKAVLMIQEALGNELSKISNEIDKLLLNLKKGEKITPHMVETNIGISKDYNVFELQKALVSRNRSQVYRILKYWEANPKAQALIPTIAFLFQYFTKLLAGIELAHLSDAELAQAIGLNSTHFIKEYREAFCVFNLNRIIEIIGHIRTADLHAKGIGVANPNDSAILKELIYKILG